MWFIFVLDFDGGHNVEHLQLHPKAKPIYFDMAAHFVQINTNFAHCPNRAANDIHHIVVVSGQRLVGLAVVFVKHGRRNPKIGVGKLIKSGPNQLGHRLVFIHNERGVHVELACPQVSQHFAGVIGVRSAYCFGHRPESGRARALPDEKVDMLRFHNHRRIKVDDFGTVGQREQINGHLGHKLVFAPAEKQAVPF